MDGQTRSCYTGPAGTLDAGVCKAGVQSCTNGHWGACWGEVWPQTEKCDGSDNNCDGQVDEGCECIDGHTKACYDGEAGTQGIGICSEGSQTCSGGHWSDCSGQVMPEPETCDELDNDCNNVVDDVLDDPCCGNVCCDDPECGEDDDGGEDGGEEGGGGPGVNGGSGKGDGNSGEGPDGPDDPDDPCPAFAGHPVSLLSGAETLTRTDLSVGRIFPISIKRRYNSRSGYDSQLGYGWALNYDKRIYAYSDGSLTLRKECGWKRRFMPSGSGFIAPVGETGSLAKSADGTYTFTYKKGRKENYDTRGRLTSIVDARGNSITFTYEAVFRHPLIGLLPANLDQWNPLIVSYDYRIIKIEEKDAAGYFTGKWVAFQYDTSTGRLTQAWDSANRSVNYSHDAIGNLTAVTGPAGSATYGYADTNNRHLLTSTDEGQGLYVNTYDTKGRGIKQTHGTGVIDVEYMEQYKKTKVTTTVRNGDGAILNTNARTVEFDTNGLIAKHTDSLGNVIVYNRDGNSWVTRKEYYENTGTIGTPVLVLESAYNYTYDGRGNILTKTEAAGTALEKITTYSYHPVYNLVTTETVTSVVDTAQNRTITYSYDETTGYLLARTETGLLGDGTPYSYTTTYTYDTNGRVTSIDGPRTDVSDVTTYAYDSTTGYLTNMTQPIIGTTTYFNHDPLGNPQTVTDVNGNSTTYTYDAIGRVLTVKAPGDTSPTQYYYVSGGCSSCGGANKIDHITLPEGNTIWYTYDTMGNLSAIKDSLNNTINYTYDSEGNRLTEQIKDSSGSLQKTLSYQYDALNRLSKIVNPDSTFTQYGYDSRGNRISLRTPNSTLTTYTYDALNRLITTIQPGTVTTSYEYNSNQNLTKVIDANNNATVYKYDDKGRVYQVVSPDTGTTTYSYDSAGNLTSRLTPYALRINYVYDALSRLTKIDFPSDTDIVYAYDNCFNGKGRLCTMTDASGMTSYEYSKKGQVAKETKGIDSITYVTQYSYDMNGNLKTMTYPSGRVITYSLSNDKVAAVLNNAANLATNINYKPFGGVSSLTYGNGLSGSISYDNQYHITGITAGTVMNLSYSQYDANGNITAINNVLDAIKNKSFTYDNLDRLATANAAGIWGSLGWTYDGVGNRQTQTNGGTSTYAYQTGTNKLSGITGATSSSFTFDLNGNTATENTREYIYNQNQRLIQVVDGAMTANYAYNGNGQRVKKTVNGTATVFHYDKSGQLIAESDSTGAVTAEYAYLNNTPLAKIEGTNTSYYHTDHISTPQKMTDATGAVVWSGDYKPFGEATVTVSTITNNLRFPGQYFDAETGLHYNYFRDYNPVIGRYIESDPIGIQRGRNHLFVYTTNNPIRFRDQSGLDSPGCDGVGFTSYCALKCCADHDKCYNENKCTSKSWGYTSPITALVSPCSLANVMVTICLANCKNLNGNPDNNPDQATYYCAKLGKYIKIPGDFSDLNSAIAACKSD